MHMQNLSETQSDELDEIDRKIIAILQRDGRASFAEMAQQLNVSAGMVRMRYNRLTELGMVRVVGITNPLRMGFQTMALIGIKVETNKLVEIANEVAALDEVIYLIIVSGAYDIIAEVVCRDQNHLLQFLTERLYKINGVRESESFMHLKIVKEIYF
ncbi:MAG TPA: Lrp/AsnC family transcriptional regulator [Anaerolineales bacterium]|nr:Lrp/AsnC family transcriptional regulator [Anaerolineales bacterium]